MSKIKKIYVSLKEWVLKGIPPWRVYKTMLQVRMAACKKWYSLKIFNSKPVVTGKDAPHFEIHMLICHRDVGMGLWAIRSFFYHTDKSYAIILHDDGTLTEKDLTILRRHLIGVTIIKKDEADNMLIEQLSAYPELKWFRFSSDVISYDRRQSFNGFIFSLKLVDFNILTSARKKLFLESDVLFFKRPKLIMDWIDDLSDARILYMLEAYKPVMNDKYEITSFLPKGRFFNGGLVCVDSQVYKINLAETNKIVSEIRKTTVPTHLLEQYVYQKLFLGAKNCYPLPLPEYAFNYYNKDSIAVHFGMKELFFENVRKTESKIT
ncbi:MAG: hypothetical protein NTZ95_07665 [Candidatus Omnitrophica bacterium]|nr:hypothetical protein [Candidatus Omnitrophota bacterium]